jgi:hypothetical protein
MVQTPAAVLSEMHPTNHVPPDSFIGVVAGDALRVAGR